MLLSALTIHNLPEGLAVGVAFAAGGSDLGLPLAIAIGIQNVPEGFAAAPPLLPVGTSPPAAAGVAALTGAVEPPAALAAYATFEVSGAVLAGAAASLALLGGFALMMALDPPAARGVAAASRSG